MKTLHILRSEPGEMVRMFIEGASGPGLNTLVPLYKGPVDYDQLVKDIFESEKVISWW
jgi:hypothetical protein